MPKGWPFRVGLGRAGARGGSEELKMVMKAVTRGLDCGLEAERKRK